jgi:hypothetical protein
MQPLNLRAHILAEFGVEADRLIHQHRLRRRTSARPIATPHIAARERRRRLFSRCSMASAGDAADLASTAAAFIRGPEKGDILIGRQMGVRA